MLLQGNYVEGEGLLLQNRIEGRLLIKSNAESNIEWITCARARSKRK